MLQDLGPFKHRIDDGLENRKAAFEAMGVLLDAAPHHIDKPPFLQHLLPGLQVPASLAYLIVLYVL